METFITQYGKCVIGDPEQLLEDITEVSFPITGCSEEINSIMHNKVEEEKVRIFPQYANRYEKGSQYRKYDVIIKLLAE